MITKDDKDYADGIRQALKCIGLGIPIVPMSEHPEIDTPLMAGQENYKAGWDLVVQFMRLPQYERQQFRTQAEQLLAWKKKNLLAKEMLVETLALHLYSETI